ncbi:S41 family peptidase [Caulobacter segnis]|uniref:S41 family peptidase n=1 Tax=Caulobacter segnis TaxID=88688 RepID=UPI00240F9E03|nr:S41 family peptidase [Caulobacter segnis]MDG2520150.1 S41 family peptidase [Caulobacter segnis]
MLSRSTVFAALLFASAASFAQAAVPLDRTQAAQALDQLDKALNSYVFPEKADAVRKALKADRETLLAAKDVDAFTAAVSEEMQRVGGDKHLNVTYEPTKIETAAGERPPLWPEPLAKGIAQGLMSVRRLPGNVGYIKLRYLVDTPEAEAMMTNIVAMLKDTDALIIDLRANNGGGAGAGDVLISHLSNTLIPMEELHYRQPDGSWEIEKVVVKPAVGGAAFDGKPIYVLTSSRTFSAAEAMAYVLKAADRATLVGETTRGGANPANAPAQTLGGGFSVFVPNGKVVHPTTKGNWEGVGVAPDVAVPAGEALTTAYTLALKAAKPVITLKGLEDQRAKAMADPKAALIADQEL